MYASSSLIIRAPDEQECTFERSRRSLLTSGITDVETLSDGACGWGSREVRQSKAQRGCNILSVIVDIYRRFGTLGEWLLQRQKDSFGLSAAGM